VKRLIPIVFVLLGCLAWASSSQAALKYDCLTGPTGESGLPAGSKEAKCPPIGSLSSSDRSHLGQPDLDATRSTRRRTSWLTRNTAGFYMRRALGRRFGGNWRAGYSRHTNCTKRIRRSRIVCRQIGWFVGDLVFQGRGAIWLNFKNGNDWWNYSFRIRRINEYCLIVQEAPRSKCVKWFVVK
jgi:hypothetical protein